MACSQLTHNRFCVISNTEPGGAEHFKVVSAITNRYRLLERNVLFRSNLSQRDGFLCIDNTPYDLTN